MRKRAVPPRIQGFVTLTILCLAAVVPAKSQELIDQFIGCVNQKLAAASNAMVPIDISATRLYSTGMQCGGHNQPQQ